MNTFVAAFALQQLRDMEQLRRDFGHRPRPTEPPRASGPEPSTAARRHWWHAPRHAAPRVLPR